MSLTASEMETAPNEDALALSRRVHEASGGLILPAWQSEANMLALLRCLYEAGREDLAFARVLEGHIDAVQIVLNQTPFYAESGGQIQLHQRVNCLWSRLEYVDKALVYSGFELLARLLVHVWPPQDGVHGPLCWQGHGTDYASATTPDGLDYFIDRPVEGGVVVRL